MSDDLDNALRNIKADKLQARTNISEDEKKRLVEKWGPRRVSDIIKAKTQIPVKRIPFVFNNVDTQDILDILANDMSNALDSVLQDRKNKPLK